MNTTLDSDGVEEKNTWTGHTAVTTEIQSTTNTKKVAESTKTHI